jgi:hypothetical protein
MQPEDDKVTQREKTRRKKKMMIEERNRKGAGQEANTSNKNQR